MGVVWFLCLRLLLIVPISYVSSLLGHPHQRYIGGRRYGSASIVGTFPATDL